MAKYRKHIETITAVEIGRACDGFSDQCRVNAPFLHRDTVRHVLDFESGELAREMFEVFRVRVARRADRETQEMRELFLAVTDPVVRISPTIRLSYPRRM